MGTHSYSICAFRLKMIKEKEIGFGNHAVSNHGIAADLIRKIIQELGQTDRENVVVAMLNSKNKVVGVNLVSIGTISSSYLEPREVMKTAINTPGCSAIIVGHNHPSGECNPSSEDITVTQRLVSAANVLGLVIHDHIIVSTYSESSYSFLDQGHLHWMKRKAEEIMKEIQA
jgi:DNA repair protein RadC